MIRAGAIVRPRTRADRPVEGQTANSRPHETEALMRDPNLAATPDVDSELFEHVTDDESELLEYYRALPAEERAAVLEALLRLTEPTRQARRRATEKP